MHHLCVCAWLTTSDVVININALNLLATQCVCGDIDSFAAVLNHVDCCLFERDAASGRCINREPTVVSSTTWWHGAAGCCCCGDCVCRPTACLSSASAVAVDAALHAALRFLIVFRGVVSVTHRDELRHKNSHAHRLPLRRQ